jgi:hypothetical protein
MRHLPANAPHRRCTSCYNKYQKTMQWRLPELEVHLKAKPKPIPELSALLETYFERVARGDSNYEHPLLELIESGMALALYLSGVLRL